MELYLSRIYFDPSHPAGFTGSAKILREAAVKDGKRYTLRAVQNWLLKQDAFTLFRPRRVRFPRLKTIASGLHDQYQCDIADFKSLLPYNSQFRYVISCIDVLSRKAANVAIKTKEGKSVLDGLKKIFKVLPHPKFLQTDHGTEFSAPEVQAYLKKNYIHYFTSGDYVNKSSLVERYQRTLKSTLHRYFQRFSTYKFVDVLPKITEAYNNKVHSATGYEPNDVTYKNQGEVWRALHRDDLAKVYSRSNRNKKKKKKVKKGLLKVGDHVRIASSASSTFVKGYRGLYTREIFIVHSVNAPSWTVPTYRLKDQRGETIVGRFYGQELKKVHKKAAEAYHEIDSILKSVGKGRNRRHLVSWVGYGKEFNSWVKDSDLKKL